MPTAASLFSGCGGDTLGMTSAGVDVLCYSELKEPMRNTHDKNFKTCELIGGDITKIKDDKMSEYENKLDFLFAGFPCQSFSHGGKKDNNDPRGQLFKEFVRMTKLSKPKIIIGENVKGLLSRKTNSGEKFIDVIIQAFAEIGYQCIYKVLKCSEYEVPQDRERLIIIGKRSDVEGELSFPNPSQKILNLKKIVEFDMNGAAKVNEEMFEGIPEECIMTNLENEETSNNVHPYLQRLIDTENPIYKGKQAGRFSFSFGKRSSPIFGEIIDVRQASKTIICTYDHQPRLFVPLKNKNGCFLRCLSPHELKQIQGFPKSFKLTGSVKEQVIQIGNAVPPPLIKGVTNHLKSFIKI